MRILGDLFLEQRKVPPSGGTLVDKCSFLPFDAEKAGVVGGGWWNGGGLAGLGRWRAWRKVGFGRWSAEHLAPAGGDLRPLDV